MSMSESHSKYLSKTERKRFDAMARFSSIKEAAASLNISPSTLYNWRLEINKRYKKRRGWINAVLAQTRRGGSCGNILQEKRKMKPPDGFDESFSARAMREESSNLTPRSVR